MIRFDTLDKKPKLWNLLALTCAAAAVIAVPAVIDSQKYIVPISCVMCLYYLAVPVLLIRAFTRQLRYNPYSYNTIFYIGFALFALSAAVIHIVLTVRIVKYPEYRSALNILHALLSSAKNYLIITSPFLALFSVALCVSNISLLRHEGIRTVNFLGIAFSLVIVGGAALIYIYDFYATGSQTEVMIHDIITNLAAAMYLYFECMLIGTIIANIIVVRHEPKKDQDYLIVLGCGLRKDGTPTPLLAGRVDRALRFYREQIEKTGKAPIFITSGGQGPNEVISESASMKGYLLEKGVPEDHILEEDRSTTTYENMQFSKEIIQAHQADARVAYATTNYHVFRSGLMARRVKLPAEGMGAKTKWYFWPNAAVREFVGLLTEHRLKQGLILGGLVLIHCVGTVVLYLSGV